MKPSKNEWRTGALGCTRVEIGKSSLDPLWDIFWRSRRASVARFVCVQAIEMFLWNASRCDQKSGSASKPAATTASTSLGIIARPSIMVSHATNTDTFFASKSTLTSFTASAAEVSASVTLDAHPSHIMPSTFRQISKGSSDPFAARIVYLEAAAVAVVFARVFPALRLENRRGIFKDGLDQFPARVMKTRDVRRRERARESDSKGLDDVPDGHELDPGEREERKRERHRGVRVYDARNDGSRANFFVLHLAHSTFSSWETSGAS